MSADYYYKVADYSGCVLEVTQEITGLSGEEYEVWYYQRCALTYSLPIGLFYKGSRNIYRFSKARKYALADNVFSFYNANIQALSRYFPILFAEEVPPLKTRLIMEIIKENRLLWPLLKPRLQLVPARLYSAHKMRATKSNVMFFKQLETSRLDRQLENGHQYAKDKCLYLAQRVRELAEILRLSILRFRDVRANNSLHTQHILINPSRRFDPKSNPLDKSSQVGITIATVLHFPKLLARFEQELTDSLNVLTQGSSEASPFDKAVLPLTIAALCLDPFTEFDMNLLLLYLGVITERTTVREGEKFIVVGPLKGKTKGVISAFPAAFGVLSLASLFDADKQKWSAATLATYNQELGKKVLNYEPYALENGGDGSNAFDKYTDKSQRWLRDWQTTHTSKTDS